MSKARLVITALFVEHQSPAEVAARYGVHRSWVYKLKARYEAEGEAAFEPRSRRPKTSPTATPPEVVQLIIALRHDLARRGLDAGPDTIRWHLTHHHGLTVSAATISRHLLRAGLVTPAPKKRPKSSYVRFEASLPNETWQSDFTHYRLTTGTDVEILTWLDDCTRKAIRVTAHRAVTAIIVRDQFREAIRTAGIPASTLTDNGMVFTVRLAGHGRRGGRNSFEQQLRDWNVIQKNSRPGHPTTCGKVERFQQTLKKWLRAQPDQPATIDQLQTLIDRFRTDYNTTRPHRSLPHRATPAALFETMPKALPGASRDADTHTRIRHDRIDKTGCVTLRVDGKLRHIGIGRPHARTHVILLIHDLHVRVIAATTGELLRELTIDLSRDYQRKDPQ
ncbi:integrase core domain protein [Aeromicrobium marinum DSM 15272]|uniref:Integrase core domain protein n=1 Tax=Aeromicrobium marinum DSM 15272 TaxID=585531 RepID=E2S9N4_9ACTN|nr:IS481 family transposase [Aeromicrobium marinum]EFQ83958.1 integrase core domain protein [Aeromicrobium marinum DSM 15272]